MMYYIVLALLLLVVIFAVYRKVQKSEDKKELVKTLFFIVAVIFFTYISRVIFVHKPTFVIHLALVLLSWIGLFLHLFKDRLYLWMIFAPALSTLFFFAMALFFRENA